MMSAEVIASVMEKIAELTRRRRIPLEFVAWTISESAYWYDHPSGPVRAPNHSERLEDGPSGYEIHFGSNIFLAEQAVKFAIDDIKEAVHTANKTNEVINRQKLLRDLRISITLCVAPFGKREGHGCYPIWGTGFMHFGAQAISVQDFLLSILTHCGLESLCKD